MLNLNLNLNHAAALFLALAIASGAMAARPDGPPADYLKTIAPQDIAADGVQVNVAPNPLYFGN